MTNDRSASVASAILEMSDDLHRLGIMDAPNHEKITLRHLGKGALATAEPISGEEIRGLREEAHLSQASFARHLNLTVGYVSQLERSAKQPKGPALDLLNIMRRKARRLYFKTNWRSHSGERS